MTLSLIKYFSIIIGLFLLNGCKDSSQKENKLSNIDSCCKKKENPHDLNTKKSISTQSEITCPNCGHKKTETLPTEICQLAYTCEKCKTVMHPKEGDCCVFCTYGDHKCPSMQ
ncbi:MAG: hypothetical protein K0S44_795 [Bacteroidetes bacterium]|jgi:hypothetical protein|nr:hypothetical protein [Bacteroidota bacterium]